MVAFGLLSVIVLSVVVSTLPRQKREGAPLAPVAVGLGAGAAGSLVTAWICLFPGTVHDSVELAPKATERVEVGAGQALLVTASFPPLDRDPTADEETTAFAVRVAGDGWEQKLIDEVRRSGAGEKRIGDGGSGVSDGGKRRGGIGEELQHRYRLVGEGSVLLEVTNWHGEAAEHLLVEVIDAPPSEGPLALLAFGLLLLGAVCDGRYKTDRLSADLGFLGMLALFVADRVTPLGSWFHVIGTLVTALFVGGFGGMAAGAIGKKVFGSAQDKE